MNNVVHTGGRPPLNENGLTEKQQKFCDIYLATGNSHFAVTEAGYEAKDQQSVRMIAYQNLKHAACKKYIDAGKSDVREKFKDECYSAFLTIVDIMQSKNVSARTRLDAAKDILDRAGYNPTTKVEGGLSFDNHIVEVAARARALAEGALEQPAMLDCGRTRPPVAVLDAEVIECVTVTTPPGPGSSPSGATDH